MRTFWTLIILALAGCTSDTNPAALEEPVDWHKGMPTSIPGQPEKATVPSITSGGEGDPCDEHGIIPLDGYFGDLDDLIWGEIASVSIVMDPVFDGTTGERISFEDCRDKETFSRVLKITLVNSTSLFRGEVGTTTFYIPGSRIYQMDSVPSFFHDGRWYRYDQTPARIDGTVGWSRVDRGFHAGQIVMAPLFKNSADHLYIWEYPVFQEVDGLFKGTYAKIDCDVIPSLFTQDFTAIDVQEAFSTFGATPPTQDFPKRPRDTNPTCNPPPPTDPVIEYDEDLSRRES